jgi:hypothetical protein
MASGLPSPYTTLILILGASSWPKAPDLTPSLNFACSAQAMQDYFLDLDGFGLSADKLLNLFDSDKEAAQLLDDEVSGFFDKSLAKLYAAGTSPTDVIVYYVGHGGFSEGNEYFLTIKATRQNNRYFSSIAINNTSDSFV